MSVEKPGATRGVKRRVYKPILGVRSGRAWVVEEPYDVASEDVRWLLDFTKSLETINGVVPDGRLQ